MSWCIDAVLHVAVLIGFWYVLFLISETSDGFYLVLSGGLVSIMIIWSLINALKRCRADG